VNFVCCQIEVSATGLSQVQGSRTECACLFTVTYDEYSKEVGIKRWFGQKTAVIFENGITARSL